MIRDKSTKKTELPGGVTKVTKIDAPETTARVFAGIFTHGISELVAGTTEENYYFFKDEYLGTSRNAAAESASRKALELVTQGNLVEAKELFNAAFQTCESNYQNEQSFKNSNHALNIAIEGTYLANMGKFSEAEAKFKEAYDLSDVSGVYNKLQEYRTSAQQQAESKKAREEAARKVREEAERKAREEAERKAREEAAPNAFLEAEKMITKNKWSADYAKQFLIQVDLQAMENNIMEHSDGY
ncbi:unnamed protein product [Rotaria socialis]